MSNTDHNEIEIKVYYYGSAIWTVDFLKCTDESDKFWRRRKMRNFAIKLIQ